MPTPLKARTQNFVMEKLVAEVRFFLFPPISTIDSKLNKALLHKKEFVKSDINSPRYELNQGKNAVWLARECRLLLSLFLSFVVVVVVDCLFFVCDIYAFIEGNFFAP